MPKSPDPFVSIDPQQLSNVAGGASRVSARTSSNEQLTTLLTQVTTSIKDLANSQNKSSIDPTMMMMMMMMMGGMGGASAAAPAASVAEPARMPVINITTSMKRGC